MNLEPKVIVQDDGAGQRSGRLELRQKNTKHSSKIKGLRHTCGGVNICIALSIAAGYRRAIVEFTKIRK